MSRFATTQWSVILRGQGSQAEARAALDSICTHYRQPVLGYIREHGFGTADAEDLTQEVFARLLEQRWRIGLQRLAQKHALCRSGNRRTSRSQSDG